MAEPDGELQLQFRSPIPESGMTGQVVIPVGPRAPPAKDAELAPERHQLELWWSGGVMPEANGAVHPEPSAHPSKSRWRFYQLVKPHSRHQGQLE